MAYSITGPQKLEKIRSFFADQSKQEGVCLDIGGNSDSERFIHELFPKLEVHTLNNYDGHVKGVSHSLKYDAEKEKLPFKAHSVSTIFLMDIIEHLVEPTHVIEESIRVLEKGGKLIITTPNLATIYNRIFLLFGWSFSNYHTCKYKLGNPFLHIQPGQLWNENLHKSIFTYGELKALMQKYNLTVRYMKGFSYANPQKAGSDSSFGIVRQILTSILPSSWQEGIVIVVEK